MILSDSEIRRYMAREKDPLIIEPMPKDSQFQPASLDLRLGIKGKAYRKDEYLNLFVIFKGKDLTKHMIDLEFDPVGGYFDLRPGEFALLETFERLTIPKDLVGRIEGKSSFGRLGVTAHITAGFFDPGWDGVATLEVANINPIYTVRLQASQPICQIAFEQVAGVVERPYGSDGLNSHYQHAKGVEAPK